MVDKRFKKSMCGEKQSFTTPGEAKKVAANKRLRVYECPFCFTFHLTSKPKQLGMKDNIQYYKFLKEER